MTKQPTAVLPRTIAAAAAAVVTSRPSTPRQHHSILFVRLYPHHKEVGSLPDLNSPEGHALLEKAQVWMQKPGIAADYENTPTRRTQHNVQVSAE